MSDVVDLTNVDSISKAYAKDLYEDNYPIQKSLAFTDRDFANHFGSGRSVKSEYLRQDYEYFRKNGASARTRENVLRACQEAYDRVGIVRQVIDLMSDFVCKGIRIRHEVPSIERFYQKWWEQVNGFHVSERSTNVLFRLGTVPVYRTYGKIKKKEEKLMKAKGEDDGRELRFNKYDKRVIPVNYTILNPVLVDVFAKELANFVGKNYYILKIKTTITDINLPFSISNKDVLLRDLKNNLPKDLREAVNSKHDYIVLDNDRLTVMHYKKDDWQTWAKPIVHSILSDLETLEKLKLADISALDGAISNIRLWNLGRLTDDPKTTIIPSKAMLQKLKSYLEGSVGGGTMDIVWGPELSFTESNTQVYKFLGKEKYEPTLDSIYMGLGIPTILRSDKSVSGNNQFVSMKTLLERLNYGRNMLIKFWNEELIHIQKAMGFAKPAVIEFDQAILADDAAEKQLLINLADRGIISDEFVREKFGANNSIERNRISKEGRERGDGMPYKASPFHNANIDEDYNKILLQTGVVTPSEVGIELEERKEGQKNRMDYQADLAKNRGQQTGETGRPKNIKETQKREPKQGDTYRISKSSTDLFIWAEEAQEKINDLLVPVYTKGFNKKNVRSFSKEEFYEFELVKACILFNLKPFDNVSNNTVKAATKTIQDFSLIKEVLNDNLTVEKKRNILSLIYAGLHNGNSDI